MVGEAMTAGATAKVMCWAPRGTFAVCGKMSTATMREDGSAGSRCSCGVQRRVSPAEAEDMRWTEPKT